MDDSAFKQDLAYASAWWDSVPLVDPKVYQRRDDIVRHFVGSHTGSFSFMLVKAYRAGLPHRWDEAAQAYDGHIKTGLNLRREMIAKIGEAKTNESSLSHLEQAELLGKDIRAFMA